LLGYIVEVRFSTFEKLACLPAQLLEEVLCVFPFMYAIYVVYVLMVDSLKNCMYVLRRLREFFGSDNALQDFLDFGLVFIVHDTWAIDQVDALGQSDILPDLGLSGNRCYFAAGFLH